MDKIFEEYHNKTSVDHDIMAQEARQGVWQWRVHIYTQRLMESMSDFTYCNDKSSQQEMSSDDVCSFYFWKYHVLKTEPVSLLIVLVNT